MTRPVLKRIHEQIRDVYERMAIEAHYRPAAPSDGLGNIPVPESELDLDDESSRYARDWWSEEAVTMSYWCGCPSYQDRPALIFAIEAARNINGGQMHVALTLLRMAAEAVEAEAGAEYVEAANVWDEARHAKA